MCILNQPQPPCTRVCACSAWVGVPLVFILTVIGNRIRPRFPGKKSPALKIELYLFPLSTTPLIFFPSASSLYTTRLLFSDFSSPGTSLPPSRTRAQSPGSTCCYTPRKLSATSAWYMYSTLVHCRDKIDRLLYSVSYSRTRCTRRLHTHFLVVKCRTNSSLTAFALGRGWDEGEGRGDRDMVGGVLLVGQPVPPA